MSAIFEESNSSKVLIVEDDADIRNLVGIHVSSLGHKVSYLDTGSHAIEKIQEIKPHLLVLDWMLPDVTGIEILRELRKQDEFKKLPILLLYRQSARKRHCKRTRFRSRRLRYQALSSFGFKNLAFKLCCVDLSLFKKRSFENYSRQYCC